MIICLDLETTWVDKYNDKIIEIAMVKFDEKTFEVIDTFSSLVNPDMHIPELISNIVNIFDEDLVNSPSFESIKDDVVKFIWDSPVLWHNISFDISFLNAAWVELKNNISIDTFFIANFLLFNNSSLNLEMLCNHFWVGFSWAHRALNDVLATIELYKKLVSTFSKLSKQKKELLLYIFDKSDDKNILYLKETLFDMQDNKMNFESFENTVLKKIKKLEIWKGDYKKTSLNIDTKVDNKNMEKYFNLLWKAEKRENQLKMTDMIIDWFNWSKKLLIEAPTWLWKSFAYLIPSIIHSLKTGQKVFISTKTKNLQDQLYLKDLDYLKQNLDLDFKYTKLKWKKNYLSVKSFFDEFVYWDINYDKVAFLSKILLWLFETKYWELDELNYFWVEFSFLKLFNSDNFLTLSDKNIYKKYEFLYKARYKLDISNIIIINHSLLFSDISSENSVLWKIENLVIDEWHNIEDSITDSLKKNYNRQNLIEIFVNIEKVLTKINAKKIDFLKQKEELLSKLDLIEDHSFNYLNNKISSSTNYKVLLIDQAFYDELDFSSILSKIELDFLDIIDILSTQKDYDFSKENTLLSSYLDIIKIKLDPNNSSKYIKILSYNDKYWINFEYTLLNPWEYLVSNIWNKLNSCVITSATLQVSWKIDYFKKILSLDEFDFAFFESDFDYKKQSTLFIPTDLWSIKNNSANVIEFLRQFYKIVRWKTLTLLTSYSSIRNIFTSLNTDLKKDWINLYAQSIAWSKNKLLNFYLENSSNSILLWTDSFWEWIDIPGEDLKYLVIHKFPFLVPSDPIFMARSVFFKDPFLEYSVPKAIIKLKQWFWRLIRTKQGKWIVVLLDNRIFSNNWWKEFYSAFPETINIKKWTSDSFLSLLKDISK